MTRSAASRTQRSAKVRCTIYTRKSSAEGLDQDFNSLQAQRETCEAFISSQAAARISSPVMTRFEVARRPRPPCRLQQRSREQSKEHARRRMVPTHRSASRASDH